MVYREHTCYLIKYSHLAEENKEDEIVYTPREIQPVIELKLKIKSSDPKLSIHFRKIKAEGTFTLGEDVDSGS